jgi:hypothetical protein
MATVVFATPYCIISHIVRCLKPFNVRVPIKYIAHCQVSETFQRTCPHKVYRTLSGV